MKQQYSRPTLEFVGGVRDVTASNATNQVTDVPMGSTQQPNEGLS